MNDKVSIIIPVYNSEKYLNQCIESLINQTYKNIEIIFVNDGSEDNSLKILKGISDNRVKIVNISNNGVSNARNVGIENSTGVYLTFVDSDDYIERTHILDLIQCFKNKDIDLGICGYTYVYKNKIINSIFDSLGCIGVKSLRKEILKGGAKSIQGFSCNKIFKTDIIKDNNIKFNTSIYLWEDVLFLFEYSQFIKNAYIIQNNSYKYRMRKSSATNVINEKSLTIFNAIYKIHLLDNNFYNYNKNSYYYIFFKYKKKLYKIKDSVIIQKIKFTQLFTEKSITLSNKIKCILNIILPNCIITILRRIKNFKFKYFN